MLNARASWNDALYPGTLRSGHEAKKPPYHTQTKAPPAPGSWADSSDMTRQFHDPTTHHSHQSHRTSTTPREAIVLLVRPRVATSTAFRHKLLELCRSCKFVRQRWVYVLVGGEPGDVLNTSEINGALRVRQDRKSICKIKAIDVTTSFWHGRPKDWKKIQFKAAPNFDGQGQKYPKWASKTFHWGYRAMCDFWSTQVFDIPELSSLDFYMRIDDDSKLHCDTSPQMDPFLTMRQHGYDYGYYKFAYDIVPGHEEWVQSFIENHTADTGVFPTLASEVERRLPYNDHGLFHVPSFYNNLEIVRLAYFRSPSVRAFNDAVARSRGIWEYRWGDAVQRYFQLALFAKNFTASVWCVPTTANTSKDQPSDALYYRHGRHVPQCTIGHGATRWGTKKRSPRNMRYR